MRVCVCHYSFPRKSLTSNSFLHSVFKSNKRQKELSEQPPVDVNATVPVGVANFPPPQQRVEATLGAAASSRCRKTPPYMYFMRTSEGKVEMVWSSDAVSTSRIPTSEVPLFSAAELAPTYHDGAAGAVLGCPHYARGCKLRHPKSGRLYTCRLCCEQQREIPMRSSDEPLDRYAVTEVLCMRCNTLQPADDRCFNPECESESKPHAKYFCRICHLYDDSSRSIFVRAIHVVYLRLLLFSNIICLNSNSFPHRFCLARSPFPPAALPLLQYLPTGGWSRYRLSSLHAVQCMCLPR